MALESGAGEVASRGRGSIACEIAHGDVANPNHSAALRGILRAILASAQTVRDWEAGPTGARAAAAGEPAAASAPAVVTSAPAVVTSGDAR